jgi:hypothetical protein
LLTVFSGKECFPTYAKARDDLISMWNSAQEGIAYQKKNANVLSLPSFPSSGSDQPSAAASGRALGNGEAVPLTPLEKHKARVENPVPENIGCQYAAEYCTTYW